MACRRSSSRSRRRPGSTTPSSLETRPGSGLEFHLENKQDALASRAWNKVVMQGQSMLDNAKPGDATKLVATSRQLADFLRQRNPASSSI